MLGWSAKKIFANSDSADTGGAMEGLLITGQSGFVAGTYLATDQGWQPVEKLNVGDRVLTFDHGMQTIRDIQRETFCARERMLSPAQRPVMVPAGAMNNRRDMILMPEQGMLVETETATDAMGDPFAVLPARALKGLREIRSYEPKEPLNVTTMAFSQDEVVYVDGGMLAFCPRTRNILMESQGEGVELYNVLEIPAARLLVQNLILDNNADALICDPDEIAGISTPQPERTIRPERVLS